MRSCQDKANLQFRVEGFNVFNHTNFRLAQGALAFCEQWEKKKGAKKKKSNHLVAWRSRLGLAIRVIAVRRPGSERPRRECGGLRAPAQRRSRADFRVSSRAR